MARTGGWREHSWEEAEGRRATGESRFPLYDEIGSARGLVDASGTVTDTYEMDTFGRRVSSTGSTPNPYRFGAAWGYITDTPGSGLLQLGARFYWPEVGRFVQRDHIGRAGGPNLFTYGSNNPLVFLDPTGLAYAVYDIAQGIVSLYHGDDTLWGAWLAESGIPGKYDPIVKGKYRMTPEDISCVSWLRPWTLARNQEAWGPCRVPLEPTKETEEAIKKAGHTGNYFLHGGTTAGTGGCVQVSNPDLEELFGILEDIGTPIGLTVK